MSKSLARDLRTAAIALAVSALVLGTPAVAAVVQHALFADNANKVDKKHAVGSSATVKKRRGKLVATSPKTGRLPNNIIAKAANADKLDGTDSTGFVKNEGQTIVAVRGPWYPQGTATVTSSGFDTTINKAVAGNAGAFVRPNVPVQMFGKPMSLVGARICYDAGSGSADIDGVAVSVMTENSPYSVGAVDVVDDTGNRTGVSCETFTGPPAPLGPNSFPQIMVFGVWTGSANLYITSSSLILAQT